MNFGGGRQGRAAVERGKRVGRSVKSDHRHRTRVCAHTPWQEQRRRHRPHRGDPVGQLAAKLKRHAAAVREPVYIDPCRVDVVDRLQSIEQIGEKFDIARLAPCSRVTASL